MLTVHTVSEYIQYKDMRANTPAMIKDGVMLYWVFKKWVDKEVFDILCPQVDFVKFNEKGVNPCKKNTY